MLHGAFAEGKHAEYATVSLEDVDPAIMAVALHWIYTDDLDPDLAEAALVQVLTYPMSAQISDKMAKPSTLRIPFGAKCRYRQTIFRQSHITFVLHELQSKSVGCRLAICDIIGARSAAFTTQGLLETLFLMTYSMPKAAACTT